MEPWYRFAAIVIKPLVRLLTRRRFDGQQHIPRSGGCILVVNHISWADPFVVALFVHDAGRRPRYLAKATLFDKPFIGSVLKGAKQIPVYRDTAEAGDALRAAVAAVEAGECVVIYPEGTVTRDPAGWPMSSRTGVARLAVTTGAPVIPVGQWGAQELWPYHGKPRLLPRTTVHVRAGEPVDLSKWAEADRNATAFREVTDALMTEVAGIVGELRGLTPPAEPFVWRRSA